MLICIFIKGEVVIVMNLLLNNPQVKSKNSIFAGNAGGLNTGGLKSTRQRAERQQKLNNKVDFWEQQKSNLKNLTSDNIEDIKRKLEMLHTYEDQIVAAKAEYNSEERSHIMDEARELGELIAKEAEKLEPKKEEEREEEKDEKIKEALSVGEGEGALGGLNSELVETLGDIIENMEEQKEILEKLGDIESINIENSKNIDNISNINDIVNNENVVIPQNVTNAENITPEEELKMLLKDLNLPENYRPVDFKI